MQNFLRAKELCGEFLAEHPQQLFDQPSQVRPRLEECVDLHQLQKLLELVLGFLEPLSGGVLQRRLLRRLGYGICLLEFQLSLETIV